MVNPKVLSSLSDLVVGTDLNDEDMVYSNYFRRFLRDSHESKKEDRLTTIQFCTLLREVGSKIPATIACKYGKLLELMSKKEYNTTFWI
jgi:hypothetical protein